ncbi:unnamed protein product [Nyctereutes procyonoides]|uniref:(raccoon dog) hypothetical protein n=1 Tax=Nyctereutes procyonoides TaxID=34880 RepID=A0A811Y3T5_NYCPR|nr:unnamed protein product [Nyctereutes procyonoides]
MEVHCVTEENWRHYGRVIKETIKYIIIIINRKLQVFTNNSNGNILSGGKRNRSDTRTLLQFLPTLLLSISSTLEEMLDTGLLSVTVKPGRKRNRAAPQVRRPPSWTPRPGAEPALAVQGSRRVDPYPSPARAPNPTHHGSGAGPAAASGRGGGFRSAAATTARQSTEKPSGSGRRRRRARQSIPEISIDAQRFPRPQKSPGAPGKWAGPRKKEELRLARNLRRLVAAGAAATNHPSWIPASSSAARQIHQKWLETTPAIPVPVNSTFVMPSQALNRVQHSYWTIIYVRQLCTLQNAYHMKIKPEEIFLSPHTTWQQSAALPVPFAPPGQVSVTACAQDWSSGQSQRTRGESLF